MALVFGITNKEELQRLVLRLSLLTSCFAFSGLGFAMSALLSFTHALQVYLALVTCFPLFSLYRLAFHYTSKNLTLINKMRSQ
jgi:hypothetical protein